MNYNEYKEKLKQELNNYKDKNKLKLKEFKDKQNKKLEKFKINLKNNKNKSKRKIHGGTLTQEQKNKLDILIQQLLISPQNFHEIYKAFMDFYLSYPDFNTGYNLFNEIYTNYLKGHHLLDDTKKNKIFYRLKHLDIIRIHYDSKTTNEKQFLFNLLLKLNISISTYYNKYIKANKHDIDANDFDLLKTFINSNPEFNGLLNEEVDNIVDNIYITGSEITTENKINIKTYFKRFVRELINSMPPIPRPPRVERASIGYTRPTIAISSKFREQDVGARDVQKLETTHSLETLIIYLKSVDEKTMDSKEHTDRVYRHIFKTKELSDIFIPSIISNRVLILNIYKLTSDNIIQNYLLDLIDNLRNKYLEFLKTDENFKKFLVHSIKNLYNYILAYKFRNLTDKQIKQRVFSMFDSEQDLGNIGMYKETINFFKLVLILQDTIYEFMSEQQIDSFIIPSVKSKLQSSINTQSNLSFYLESIDSNILKESYLLLRKLLQEISDYLNDESFDKSKLLGKLKQAPELAEDEEMKLRPLTGTSVKKMQCYPYDRVKSLPYQSKSLRKYLNL